MKDERAVSAEFYRVIGMLGRSPIPASAVPFNVPQVMSSEMCALSSLLLNIVRSDDVRENFWAFFNPAHDDRHRAWETHMRRIIPERPDSVRSFSFCTEEKDHFMPLILGSCTWGITLPLDHRALCEPSKIQKISLTSEVVGYAVREDNTDVGIRNAQMYQSLSLIHYLRHSRGVETILLAIERRLLQIHTSGGEGFSFGTDCLWYPPFGNKRVVKYLRSALQGAMGQITDPLRLAELLVRCEVGAPRLREVLFLKSDDVTKES